MRTKPAIKHVVIVCVGCILLLGSSRAAAHGFGLGGSWLALETVPTHFVSAPAYILIDTLAAAGWEDVEPCDACCDVVQESNDRLMQRIDDDSGRIEWLSLRPLAPTPHNLPLWALWVQSRGDAYACVVDGQHLTDDLLDGIALLRNATVDTGAALPWIELRHARNEIDRVIESADRAVCIEEGLASEVALLPPVLPLREPVIDTLVWRENADQKHVALTFDACSTFTHGGEYNRAVIDTLISNEIPATLFIGGHWAETHPEELAWLASQPLFELGNHTYSHPHMPLLSRDRQRQELLWTQYLIYALTGQLPRFFRPPYGEIDDDLIREVAALGLYTVEFDLPAGDADMHVSDARLIEWILRKASAGSIVVMHMNHPGSKTAEVLPAIAKALRAKGYVFGKISDMLSQHS